MQTSVKSWFIWLEKIYLYFLYRLPLWKQLNISLCFYFFFSQITKGLKPHKIWRDQFKKYISSNPDYKFLALTLILTVTYLHGFQQPSEHRSTILRRGSEGRLLYFQQLLNDRHLQTEQVVYDILWR